MYFLSHQHLPRTLAGLLSSGLSRGFGAWLAYGYESTCISIDYRIVSGSFPNPVAEFECVTLP